MPLLSSISSIIITYLLILLAMAFFTLLERKGLGYFHIRKGPNKVGIFGLPQPLADAAKLFLKELINPASANLIPFLLAPGLGLALALILWSIYPNSFNSYTLSFGFLMFLCVSSLNVYTTLGAGWSSNSKYALLGALRGMAQTISYEISMSLILLSPIILATSFNLTKIPLIKMWIFPLILPLFYLWFTSALAETNRTPFDLAEGESELVSGFNTEYSSGTFALIFMAEYMNIMIMSLLTVTFFFTSPLTSLISPIFLSLKTLFFSFAFIWVRASYPRMRYDQLMGITWRCFLPISLTSLILLTPLSSLIWYCAGMNG